MRYFGQLSTALAALTLVPFSVSLLSGDFRVSVHYLIVIVGVMLLGTGLMRIQAPKRMQSNVAMAVGGSISSTAGGIKILLVLIVFRLLALLLSRAGAPSNAVLEARLNGRRLEAEKIVILTDSEHLADLNERWNPKKINGED